jgi:hypothetical protein
MTVLVRPVTSAGDLAEARRLFKEYEAASPVAGTRFMELALA